MNKNGGINSENFLIKVENGNFSKGPSFKFISQLLKVLRKLVKLKLYLLLGFPTANFGPLLRGQPHEPDVNKLRF